MSAATQLSDLVLDFTEGKSAAMLREYPMKETARERLENDLALHSLDWFGWTSTQPGKTFVDAAKEIKCRKIDLVLLASPFISSIAERTVQAACKNADIPCISVLSDSNSEKVAAAIEAYLKKKAAFGPS